MLHSSGSTSSAAEVPAPTARRHQGNDRAEKILGCMIIWAVRPVAVCDSASARAALRESVLNSAQQLQQWWRRNSCAASVGAWSGCCGLRSLPPEPESENWKSVWGQNHGCACCPTMRPASAKLNTLVGRGVHGSMSARPDAIASGCCAIVGGAPSRVVHR
jgi:hypothetical protein